MSKITMAGLVILVAAGLFASYPRNSSDGGDVILDGPEDTAIQEIDPGVSQEGQLMAMAQSLEEAQTLAELYGIELVDFSYQIALFRTQENPREVIRRGQQNGWPELSINYTAQAF